jgi:hypothetical protein
MIPVGAVVMMLEKGPVARNLIALPPLRRLRETEGVTKTQRGNLLTLMSCGVISIASLVGSLAGVRVAAGGRLAAEAFNRI